MQSTSHWFDLQLQTIFQVSRRFSQLLDELGLTPEANNVSDGVLSFVLWAGL